MRSLLREQLRLALGVLAVMGLTIGLLPLAFYLAPGLQHRALPRAGRELVSVE